MIGVKFRNIIAYSKPTTEISPSDTLERGRRAAYIYFRGLYEEVRITERGAAAQFGPILSDRALVDGAGVRAYIARFTLFEAGN